MAEPLKVHMSLPSNRQSYTLCGVPMSLNLTRKPAEATCRRCLNAYSRNVDWYWRKLGLSVTPPSVRYNFLDIPIPGLVVWHHPDGRRTMVA